MIDRSVLAMIASLSLLAGGCISKAHTPESRIYYKGPESDHFNGAKFFNPDGEQGSGGAQNNNLKSYFQRATGKKGHHFWPKNVPVTPSIPPARVEGDGMRVTWVGHATTLVQTQGLNILLDPVWAHRDSPVPIVGPARVRAPGVDLNHLPKIDLILISHNHYDHLDIGVLKHLMARDKPLIVAALGNNTLLAHHGLQIEARDWGGRVTVRPGIDVILTRAHHWSAHWYNDHDRALWTGFVVTLPGGNLYYAGDTGPGDMQWAEEALKYGLVRMAIIPIGPYHVGKPPTGNHIGPAEAVTAFKQLGAPYALGVHWGTFELSDEPIDGPPTLLKEALNKEAIALDRFRTLEAGEQWEIPVGQKD